ncbi:MAG: serine hydrolase domain-containing protein [Mariniblastus sp.]
MNAIQNLFQHTPRFVRTSHLLLVLTGLSIVFCTSASTWAQSRSKTEQKDSTTLGTIWKTTYDIPATGVTSDSSAALDKLFISFLLKHQLPGATVAVGYEGKIIYERGFGFSDLERKIKMNPDSLLRIASISKPLTGAAIAQLIDRDQLKLTDKVFDVLDFLPEYPKSTTPKPIEPDFKKITIEQLLHHTAGFDRSASFDPMFRSSAVAKSFQKRLPINQMDIIGYMMSRPLDFQPGEKMAYSNFGYCLLGRVIEKISGQNYEEYVQEKILHPVGADRTILGRSLEGLRAKDEVKYYLRKQNFTSSVVGGTKRVKAQYGSWNQEALDSHGGWISSASDLVRFASAFDNPNRSPLMSKSAIDSVFAAPTYFKRTNQQRYYGFGWSIFKRDPANKPNIFNAYHTGSLPGTSTILVRRSDGFIWAVLFNCRDSVNGPSASGLIDSLMHRAVSASATAGLVRVKPGQN